MIIAPGSSLIFAGDSITECGRQGSNLGLGFVMMVDAYLKAKRGGSRIRVENIGGGVTQRVIFRPDGMMMYWKRSRTGFHF